jgi:uncharacterized protein YcbX
MYTISQLYIYPVKSLGGIAVDQLTITDRGAAYDRRWMLVDLNGDFLTLREHAVMSRLHTAIEGTDLIIFDAHNPSDRIFTPLHPSPSASVNVTVWGDVVSAWMCVETLSDWLSSKLGQSVRLVYMPDESLRPVDPDYAPAGSITAFSDGYPLLIIGQSSLDDLNSRLDQPVEMLRFRPNIVFTGGTPFDEDHFTVINIADIPMLGVKPCARCVVTTIDPATGESGPEPLRTLATFRKQANKVNFGMNLVPTGTGNLRIGDELRLTMTVSKDS